MKRGWSNFRMRSLNQPPAAEGGSSPEAPPPPTPIRTYTDTQGRFIQIMDPRCAEGYEGQLRETDLARRRREILEGK